MKTEPIEVSDRTLRRVAELRARYVDSRETTDHHGRAWKAAVVAAVDDDGLAVKAVARSCGVSHQQVLRVLSDEPSGGYDA